MKRLEEIPCVEVVRGDQCQYGAVAASGPDKDKPIKKPTGFMFNTPHVLHALSRICTGRRGECSRPEGGRHTVCSGNNAKEAAKYPRELCRAVLRGITAQLKTDRRLIGGCYGIQAKADPGSGLAGGEDEVAEEYWYGPEQGYSGKYKDDLTGQPLRDEL